jgi:CheY-like chemotaxis protein
MVTPINVANKKILLVDDDTLILDIYKRKFIENGFVVDTKQDANDHEQTFVDSVYTLQPDIIIMDTIMPGRNGLEAISLLKSDERTKTIPITVWSGHDDKKDIETAEHLGVLAYIIKPSVTPIELVQAIKKLMAAH